MHPTCLFSESTVLVFLTASRRGSQGPVLKTGPYLDFVEQHSTVLVEEASHVARLGGKRVSGGDQSEAHCPCPLREFCLNHGVGG